jgi:hypothetical protein
MPIGSHHGVKPSRPNLDSLRVHMRQHCQKPFAGFGPDSFGCGRLGVTTFPSQVLFPSAWPAEGSVPFTRRKPSVAKDTLRPAWRPDPPNVGDRQRMVFSIRRQGRSARKRRLHQNRLSSIFCSSRIQVPNIAGMNRRAGPIRESTKAPPQSRNSFDIGFGSSGAPKEITINFGLVTGFSRAVHRSGECTDAC